MNKQIIKGIIIVLILYFIISYFTSKHKSTQNCEDDLYNDDYSFINKPLLGDDILKMTQGHLKTIEHFAITSPPQILYNKKDIDPSNYYLIGKRNTSNTTTPSRNGGTDCVEFPEIAYKLITPIIVNKPIVKSTLNTISVNWSLPPSVSSNSISLYKGQTLVSSNTLSPTSKSFTFRSLTPATTYTISLIVSNSQFKNDPGSFKNPITITSTTLSPIAPSSVNLNVLRSSINSIIVRWNNPLSTGSSPVKSYTLSLYKGSTLISTITLTNLVINIYAFTSLTPSTQYTITIYVSNSELSSPITSITAKTI